ncbi:Hsp20/alpha crystallin family protein [Haloarculaceae archaeon H-GB2-1]|nr:Hsp20/alpha crystallin family protein [Haloarculaceae archaeon H-GB1-1]MEA5386678.1 Hsp20/alpha crystallin family protein [Haloarculaceae archaeon H-GB11]MEA5408202.1 Hsp20/alpha crystallin family protein [Haloarculaceae archaeon H-GB2-1]
MTDHRPAHEVELYRDGDAYVVILELPGFDREDVDLRWQNRHLHVSAEHTADGDDEKRTVYHRDVGIPKDIVEDDITASFENDVLEVTLPIEDDSDRSGRRISID